ncbi:MAG: sugar phosphate nucleotidyltransferase [Gammaproteobacteria bacterium]
MKVVLFCGGLGTRLREHSETIPKPLVTIGSRPILWHLMRFYAHFGHKDFILCLGYRGDLVREFFLNYQETLSNDFTMSAGGRRIELMSRDIHDWRITFVDTGMHSSIGQRLMQVRRFVEQEPVFLANYADGLSDVALDRQVAEFERSDATAGFVGVRSPQSFHAFEAADDGLVSRLGSVVEVGFWINGGYFALRPAIFDVLGEDEELVEAPFQRLIAARKLRVFRHTGFWQPMDTFKDKIGFDRMEARGERPWAVWSKR